MVLPGRYVDDADLTSGRVRNQDALIAHARRLAGRIGQLLDAGRTPLMLGGDSRARRRWAGAGSPARHGLVHVDGYIDFRRPGHRDVCLSVAGEDLAAAVGRHYRHSPIWTVGPV